MTSPLPSCHHPNCTSPGMYGENDFLKPNEDRQATYSCFDHRPGTQGNRQVAEPKFNQPELAL